MGLIVELVRANSSSQTQDESDSRAFFFCVLSVERCQLSKEEALGTVRKPCAKTENRRKIDEISALGGLGTRGRLGDALGRAWNVLGAPNWAVLATKLAVLAASSGVRGAKLAISSAKLALLGCFRPLPIALPA